MFKRTTAVNKILAMRKRKRVIRGGTWAGKTYSIIPVLINRALSQPGVKITVVAESIPAVREGAAEIFKEIMQSTGRWIEECWIGNPMEYRFKNGSKMQFKAFDTEGKAKAAGKRHVLFMNECNHIPFPIANQLMIRSDEMYFDYNPDNEFWIDTEVLTAHNSELLVLTYQDNEGIKASALEDLLINKAKAYHDPDLPDHLLNEDWNIKSKYWANWWRVYGMGQIGSLQGVVFDNWKQVDSIPPHAKLVGYGMDFGFTNDPTTLVAIYEADGEYYFEELIYQTGLSNADISKMCKDLKLDRSVYIYADSADPKTIADLKARGIKITGAEKGPDSIIFGIQRIQEKPINILSSSINLIKEFRRYKWAVAKTGETLNVPIDAFNHAIDAIRYFFTTRKKVTGKYYTASA